jgi:hypothetical protein
VQRPIIVFVAKLTSHKFARFASAGLGFVFGLVFVLTSAHKDAPLWSVWAPFAVALTTTAGAVFRYGLDCWTELAELSKPHAVRVRDVAAPVTAILAIGLLGLLGSTLFPETARSNWRAVVLLTFTGLGGIPAAGVMYGVRNAAGNQPTPGTKGELVAVLVALRQLLQRLLAALGSLVALSTLATGAVLALQRSLSAGAQAGGVSLPSISQVVVVFGGFGSLLVALFYAPAATALRRRGQRLCDELFSLHTANEASVILSLAENRRRLEQVLGVDRGIFADLQTGLAILAPLLASAAAAFLSS